MAITNVSYQNIEPDGSHNRWPSNVWIGPVSQRYSQPTSKLLLVDDSLLTEVDVDCLVQDRNAKVCFLEPLPRLQCFLFPNFVLFVSVFIECFGQGPDSKSSENLLKLPSGFSSLDIGIPLLASDSLEGCSISCNFIQLLLLVSLP